MRFLQNLYFYFEGRYGIDEFSKFLTVISLVLFVAAMFFDNQLITLMGIGLLAYGLLRIMSKEAGNREKELVVYLKVKSSIQNFIHKVTSVFKKDKKIAGVKQVKPKNDQRTIISCPQCSQKLRLPKGKKLSVTCSNCKAKFIQQT